MTRLASVLPIAAAAVCLGIWLSCTPARSQDTVRLENSRIGLRFDGKTGTLTAIENKLSGETYRIRHDECGVEAAEFCAAFADLKLVSLERQAESLTAHYQGGGLAIEAKYTLHGDNHFAEKQLLLTFCRKCGLKTVVLSRPSFSAENIEVVPYRHPKLGPNRGAEPACTYFGRTAKGGFFTGVEMPFDSSSARGREAILSYAPNLKVAAGEKLACEPIYLGVYRRGSHDVERKGLPLRSESDAMVAMTTALLPPQNRRIGPVLCGWWSETLRTPYRTPADVEHDMRCVDFAVACGINIVSDGRTWAGETDKVNTLREGDTFQLGELPLKLAEYARKKGVRWMFWPSMGNSDPWNGRGKPFRRDKPEWAMTPRPATCFAYPPSYDWLVARILEAMKAGQYGAWCMDGDFFGEPGFGGGPGFNGQPGPKSEPRERWVHPARCLSKLHDHFSPDVNYICQRNLTNLAELIRRCYPDAYLMYCRPAMDLGVWALRNVDACFTVNEWAGLDGIPGMGPQPKNVLLGDKMRYWSRVRVHQHFFPHYLDSPLVFDAPKSMSKRDWTSEKIDYIMLSALSSSPNQTYYLPCTAGIPAADQNKIKKWLDWGRANIQYIMVRKDLPDWPAPGKVDGSAHIVGQRGFVFLFNPNMNSQQGRFALSDESIGLKSAGAYRISQYYPPTERATTMRYGKTAHWDVPGQSAVILDVQPVQR